MLAPNANDTGFLLDALWGPRRKAALEAEAAARLALKVNVETMERNPPFTALGCHPPVLYDIGTTIFSPPKPAAE